MGVRVSLFGLRGMCFLFLLRDLVVDQFYNSHFSAVTKTSSCFDDSRISARSRRKPGSNVLEKPGDHVLIPDKGERLPPGMKVSLLAQRYHLLRHGLNFFRFCLCGFDPFVSEKGSDQTSKEGLTMAGISSELSSCAFM